MGQRGLIGRYRGPMLPANAGAIASARRGGLKPAKPVIVSYVGQTCWDGEHVHCESGQRYDWAWSEGLQIVIATAPGIDTRDAIFGTFWPLHFMACGYPTLIDVECQKVAHIVALIPKPTLWPVRDVSGYFPKESACN